MLDLARKRGRTEERLEFIKYYYAYIVQHMSQLFPKIMDICHVASLPTFRCGMGGLKLENCMDVCKCVYTKKGGGKIKDIHALWGHYHKYAHKL